MAHECRFSASWALLKTDPPCPPCDEARASRIWPDYYRGIHPEANRQDIYLCAAHAAWLMERSTLAVRQIRLISALDPPPALASATPPAAAWQVGGAEHERHSTRYEIICHTESCPGPKEICADTEKKAREIGLQHERATGHRFTVLPEELNLSQHPPGQVTPKG
jgi:hypothetical protein